MNSFDLFCIALVVLWALWGAIQQIKETTAEDPFLFLRLFTTSREPLPSFVSFISFLVPLMAIGLGFDAINGEQRRYIPLRDATIAYWHPVRQVYEEVMQEPQPV